MMTSGGVIRSSGRGCRWLGLGWALIIVAMGQQAVAQTSPTLTLCCKEDHELLRVLEASGIRYQRENTFAESVSAATSGTGVLLLADDYPLGRTQVDPAALKLARGKNLRLFLEYPDEIAGVAFDPMTTTTWERAVVTTSSLLPSVQPLEILSVSGARFLPTTAPRTLVSIARVAGYDQAVFGLPETARPLLFELPKWNALVATTGLSKFVSGRYGPSAAWGGLWKDILTHLAGEPVPELRWTPSVRPAYGPEAKLPAKAEREALEAAAGWLVDSRLLISAGRQEEIKELLLAKAEDAAIPAENAATGDGSFGIMEGYASQISYDGTQRQRIPIRADCQAESAMLLATDAAVTSDASHAKIATNLLNYLYGTSGLTGGVRADPKHGAYGLIGWGAIGPAWEVANYGDDNARAILGTWAAAAQLNSGEWDTPMLRAIAANFRTTGRKGFRGDRVDNGPLAEHGWKYFEMGEPENFAPNFEAWMWNCYLAAYHQTGYRPFLERSREGIHRMMKAYPQQWRWHDSNEISRMIFTLAWLIRVDDTPQHREWLSALAKDLLSRMQPCGAIADRLHGTGGGHYQVPQSNEAYGTGESPLIQQNGDPVSDQLYTSGFALLGLHEAAAVRGEAHLKEAEDRLAGYLVRIQVRSEAQPYLAGAWLRAFDFAKWDYWGSAGDIGWGPWCAETGWGHTWIGTVLGLREQNVTLWDLLGGHDVRGKWKAVEEEMLVGVE